MSGDYSKYDQILEQARGSAKYWIPKLCQALREENSEMSNEDIRERVTGDCLPIWQRTTINNALPEEYKNKERSQTGKKGRQKQLEQTNGTLTITEEPTKSWAKNDSDSSTEQELQTLGGRNTEKTVSQLQGQLNDIQQEQEVTEKTTAAFTESRNDGNVPDMDSQWYSLVKSDRATKLEEKDRRECEWFVYQVGKRIRRGIIAYGGKVTLRFSLLAEHRSSKIEILLPVKFTVNFEDKSTSLVLDKGRIVN